MPLVLLAEEHLEGVIAMLDDPDVARFTPLPSPAPDGWAEEWLARYQQGRAAGTHELWAIVDDGGAFAGFAMVVGIDREALTAQIGYAVSPAHRGRGLATQALRDASAWALEQGLERLELRISADNTASARVAASAGYRLEGTLRSTYFKDGQRCDTQVWSLLPSDH